MNPSVSGEPTDDLEDLENLPEERLRANPALWTLVALVLIGLGAAAIVFVRGVERGPQPSFLVRPPLDATPGLERRDPDVLHLAGSGSNLPLTRALAAAYTAAHPGARTVVHASIGSTGGVRAVHDRVIDVGLVSRPLSARERELDLQLLPYARVAVVFAANASVPIRDLTAADVLSLYAGERPTWDDGTAVVVLQREEGDSSHIVARESLAGFAEIDARALDEGRWRVLYSDSTMHDALGSTSGAIGLIDQGAAIIGDLPLHLLSLDGVAPSPASVSSGAYPLAKELVFVLSGGEHGGAQGFLDFVFSPAGEAIIRANGYSPLARARGNG